MIVSVQVDQNRSPFLTTKPSSLPPWTLMCMFGAASFRSITATGFGATCEPQSGDSPPIVLRKLASSETPWTSASSGVVVSASCTAIIAGV